MSDLEGELVSLKNLLSSRANIIHTIADGVRIESLHEGPHHHHHSPDDPLEPPSNPITTDPSSNPLVENLEILLAEHRVDEALSLLDDAKHAALDKPLAPSSLLSLQNTILEYRQRLADQLAEMHQNFSDGYVIVAKKDFYLDMEFVILFASQGRYLSRNLHQVMKNIIGRAIEAVQAKNIDPYSVLLEDEWFADIAQIAIKMLMGHPEFENAERDMNSPTASMSARSVSSAHSHGSS
ncbi:exocyst complex component 84B [Striga asiatica]|uniref:Exocyst complex component 84B n=1 Tax=Striga asiatica TaxID=4170 RepID=A0A5A7PVM6_STRAF|nr:exocyst complex component 84B [Striga asiatica]